MGLLCFGGLSKSTGKLGLSSSLGCAAFVPGHLHSHSGVLNISILLIKFIIQDGEIPSTYFSYFWVELEDPSSYSDSATSVLQVPVPELERNRPGGIGIADLQPLLRPSLESQEEAYEWSGVTERMVDEVDETKRTTQVYDLRIELSGKCMFFMLSVHRIPESSFTTPSTAPFRPSFQNIGTRKYPMLTQAFVKWGGFASSPAQGPEAAGTSTRPTFDRIIERAPPAAKPEQPPAAEDNEAPPVEEEPHKPFNYEFDEPVRSMDTKTPVLPKADKTSVGTPQSLLTMRREGERLSRKQKALLQAAAISRTPLLNFEAKEKEERETNDEAAQRHKAEMDEEKKRIHSKVWDLVRSKWF